MADPERRRRRLRQGSARPRPPDDHREPPDPDAAASVVTPEVLDPEPPPARSVADDRDTERGLRGLVGSGSSQVGISAAMRARDAARPTDADLAEARERLVIVRRNWVPRDDPPRGTR
ncbi:hypothetical protein [Phytohabitans kaempferiae]|uniref:Uncharacterized protein n=1 Tax=Phytohabitans kaempferiae TaxID=1620943 RepID=A0ABV6M827_9ACTN